MTQLHHSSLNRHGKAMALRTVRTRGMEAPYAQDQIAAFVLHPVISAVSSVGIRDNILGASKLLPCPKTFV